MAILKNYKEDELIISCNRGCDEGIHFKINKDDDETYCLSTFTNGNFYSEQSGRFGRKLRKIWAIIRNKDFYYSDIIISKSDFLQFTQWVNKKAYETR